MDVEEEACEDGAEWSDGQPMFPDSQPILEDNVGPKDHGEVPRPVARPLAAEFDHAQQGPSQSSWISAVMLSLSRIQHGKLKLSEKNSAGCRLFWMSLRSAFSCFCR